MRTFAPPRGEATRGRPHHEWGLLRCPGNAARPAVPVILLAGSVFHEHAPALLAAIHCGDGLLKLVLVAAVVTVWPSPGPRRARSASMTKAGWSLAGAP